MNEWMLVGLVVVASVLVLGGGSWVMNVLTRKRDAPKS